MDQDTNEVTPEVVSEVVVEAPKITAKVTLPSESKEESLDDIISRIYKGEDNGKEEETDSEDPSTSKDADDAEGETSEGQDGDNDSDSFTKEKEVDYTNKEEVDKYIKSQLETKEADKVKSEEALIENKSQTEFESQVQSLETFFKEFDQAMVEVDNLFENGSLTKDQYKEVLAKSEQIKTEKLNEIKQLQQKEYELSIPKLKRANDEFFKTVEASMPELKDPIVRKYAEKLKTEVFDKSGTKIDASYTAYVKEFIVEVSKEAEARGYQKALREQSDAKTKKSQSSTVAGGTKTGKPVPKSEKESILSEYGKYLGL